jgi:hypothetical protein
MYFDPAAFERLKDSIAANPCKHKQYSLALVDSFSLFMLLQLHIKGEGKGNALAEHRVSLNVLRPVIKSDHIRYNKDMKYLLATLKNAEMVNYEFEKRTNVLFQISEYKPTKLSALDELRSLVVIKKSNRFVLENYDSNVPFALYCLLRSLQRVNYGKPLNVTVSVKQMCERLNIREQALNKYKNQLYKDGYVYPIYGELYNNGNSFRRECNEYVIYDHDNREPEKYEKFSLRTREYKKRKGRECEK